MRLIDADALKEHKYHSNEDGTPVEFSAWKQGWNDAIDAIANYASTVDPVKHGHWIRNDNGTYSCSECKSWIPNEQHYYARYCLFCGAKMEADDETN